MDGTTQQVVIQTLVSKDSRAKPLYEEITYIHSGCLGLFW